MDSSSRSDVDGAGVGRLTATDAGKPARKKRKKALRCTALSLDYLRDQGYTAEVVEHRLPGCMITKDLFGFVDILAIRRDEVLAVQTTSATNVSSRIEKINASEHVAAVREAGIRIHVHGWQRSKTSNKPSRLRIVDIS